MAPYANLWPIHVTGIYERSVAATSHAGCPGNRMKKLTKPPRMRNPATIIVNVSPGLSRRLIFETINPPKNAPIIDAVSKLT